VKDGANYTVTSKLYYRSGMMAFGQGFLPIIEHYHGDTYPVPPHLLALDCREALVLLALNAFLQPAEKRDSFVYYDSGSPRIRLTADLASHSRAFCRNSAVGRALSFTLV